MQLELAVPRARALPLMLVGVLASLCTAGPPPCAAAKLAKIEADYSASVLEQCADAGTREKCKAWPALAAARDAAAIDAGCK